MKKMLLVSIWMLFASTLVFAGHSNPLITSISPSQPIVQNTGMTIIVRGQNFQSNLNFEYNGNPRSVNRVSTTELLVTLQPGDLSITGFNILRIFGKAGRLSPVFAWYVSDGTIVITPGDVVLGLNGTIQFSATSTIPGDTIQWSVSTQSENGVPYNPPAMIDQTGLFTAPSMFTACLPCTLPPDVDIINVFATSTLDPSKQSVVVVTVQ